MDSLFKNLTDKEKEFVDYLLSEVKLNDAELEAKFGEDLIRLRANLSLRRIVADMKIKKKRRVGLIDLLDLDKSVEGSNVGLDVLMKIALFGEKEHNRLAAAQTLYKPGSSYIEKLGINTANIDTLEEADEAAREIIIRADKQDLGL